MKPRIGLAGCGPWGRLILRDLVHLGAEVFVYARSENGRAAAVSRGATLVVDALNRLPADLDGYVVATATETHLDMVEPLLARGRPIFVEKALDVDVARARRLPPAARRLVFVMHKWRYHPGVELLAEIAHSGELGPVRGLELQRIDFGAKPRNVDPVWIHSPHDISIAFHVLREMPQPIWAAPHPLDAMGGGLVALLTTPSGTRVLNTTSVASPSKRRSVILACEDGSAELADAMSNHVLIRRPEAAPERRMIPVVMPLSIELESFLRHLDGGEPPLTPLAEELEMLDVIVAMRRLAGLTG